MIETPIECAPDDTDCKASMSHPSPHFVAPHGIAAIRATYGDIAIAGGKVIAPAHWEALHMTTVQLQGMPRPLYVNHAIVEPLRALLAVMARHGYEVRTAGCFNPRPKRVNGSPSTHSWGIAVDFNAANNPMTPHGAPLQTDMPREMVAEIEALGWTWGGHFRDPMHWQLCSGY